MSKAARLLLLLVISTSICSAQTAPIPEEFAIGAADLLDINVLGVPDFSRQVRVTGSGFIDMPFLGKIRVQGLTPLQAQADLLDPDYVKEPQVSVLVKEPRSRVYSVVGAVIKPGQYTIEQPMTLVEAIAGAGGLNFAKVGNIALIERSYRPIPTQDSGSIPEARTGEEKSDLTQRIEVNLRKLLFEGDMSYDIPIMPGDVINIQVRETESIYVIGDVTQPGSFDFPTDTGIMLSRALAIAGGPTRTSKLGETAFIRQHPDGTIERLTLDLDKILKGKEPDVAMQPNDMIYVPGSVGKRFGWALLESIPAALSWRLLPVP
jgi:polysaccharide export outer membrane protein